MVHMTVPGQSERDDAGVRVHGSGLMPAHVVDIDGLRVTSVARTAVDLARAGDLSHALVATDSALRLLLATSYPDLNGRLRQGTVSAGDVECARGELTDVVATMTGWPGVRTARTAVAAADPASESPFESWSRGWIVAVGLPSPVLNLALTGASGRRYFGDFVWPEHGVVGEADGIGKYGASGDQVRTAIRAERERQLDLEAAGWRFVRWVVGDSGATIVARLGRALYLPPVVTARAVEESIGFRGLGR